MTFPGIDLVTDDCRYPIRCALRCVYCERILWDDNQITRI